MILKLERSGTGRPLVLLHGFPLDRTMWTAQAEHFSSGWDVICPDLRGHGESPAPEGIYEVDTLADDVLETLDSIGVTGPFVLGGLSMGGYVALSIATRFPDRLAGLFLMNTRAAGDAPATAENRQRQAKAIEESGSAIEVVDAMVPKLFSSASLAGRPGLVAATTDQMRRTSPIGIIGTLRGLAIRPDRTGQLGNIRIPTVVIAGPEDQVIPLAEAEAMAAAIPGASLVVIQGAGHLAPMENPEATNRAMAEALASW